VAETQFFIDEIEVIMQALAVAGHKKRLAVVFVVPWLVRRAGLHRREDADKPGMLAPLR
jgi:hypothetical protein